MIQLLTSVVMFDLELIVGILPSCIMMYDLFSLFSVVIDDILPGMCRMRFRVVGYLKTILI